MYALVIVDVQPEFEAANDLQLRKNIVKQIELAKLNNFPIVLVEYGDMEGFPKATKTYKRISNRLRDYDRTILVIKHDDDGSDWIVPAMKRAKMRTKNVRICGVNTSACVGDTAVGMRRRGYNVTFIADSCSDNVRINYTKQYLDNVKYDGMDVI